VNKDEQFDLVSFYFGFCPAFPAITSPYSDEVTEESGVLPTRTQEHLTIMNQTKPDS